MKTLSNKITSEAIRISSEYILILERNEEPATLAAIIAFNRSGILESINDKRINCSDSIERVRLEAFYRIKKDLQANPQLAQRLIDFRAARAARDIAEQCQLINSMTPFPSTFAL